MKQLFIIFFVFISYHISAQETFPINGVKDNFHPIYAFVNGTIVVSPKKEISNGTLLIQDDKIIGIDSVITIPDGAIINNLNGYYIYPSFIDLYSDHGLPEVKKKKRLNYSPQYESSKTGAYNWNESIHSETSASSLFQNNPKDAKDYLNIGFGALLVHQQNGIFRGSGSLILLSQKIENKNILVKNAATFYSFKKGASRQRYPTSLMGSIALIRQTLLDANWYAQQEKKELNLSLSSFNETKHLPNIFSITDVLDYNRVFKIADEFEIDYIIKGTGKEYKKINEVLKTKSAVIIPINFPESFDVSNPEESEWITLEDLKDWELSPYNPRILANHDIVFSITSSGLKDKKDFLSKLKTAINMGLSEEDALSSLTTTPAKLMQIDNLLGTLEEGKIANFLITSSNIFKDGEIYENWVSGERNIITQKSKIDIRGYYKLNSTEFKNEPVVITGSKEKLIVKISCLDSNNLTVSSKKGEIILSTKNGSYRMIGDYYNDSIIGRYQIISGKYINFSMTRDSLIKQEKEILDSKSSPIPEVWLPNKSYGFEKIPKEKNILFKHATVWTNEASGILKECDVAIKKGKIIAIGKELDSSLLFPNEEIIMINARGKHLTSGIIDEHSHIAISRGVNESSEAITAEVNIGDVINPDDINIYRQLAGGVTAAQLLHGSANPIGGQSAIIKMRWGSSAEDIKIKNAPNFIKFALGENVKQSNWGDFNTSRFPQTRMGVEQVFYDGFYNALAYEKLWEDYNRLPLRVRRNTPAPRENLELNILLEILKKERFVTCHSYVQSEINMLMNVADSMGFNINTFTHILEGYKVADKMREHGAGGSTFSDWWAYKFEVNDAIPYNASLLNNANVITAINSDDAEMGRRLNQEAAKAIKYGGTSEEDAWKMVTLNPAKLLRLDNQIGSIKVGKDADLVLWSDNPLSIYSKVEQTYIDGICLFNNKTDLLLRKRDINERMRIIQKMSLKKSEKKQPPFIKKEKHYHCDSYEEDES